MWTDLSRDQFIMMVWVVSAFSFFGVGFGGVMVLNHLLKSFFVLSREILFLSLSHHRQLSKSPKNLRIRNSGFTKQLHLFLSNLMSTKAFKKSAKMSHLNVPAEK